MAEIKSPLLLDLDWNSEENYYFLNPRFMPSKQHELLEMLKGISKKLSGQIFLLTSGTTSCELSWIALSKAAFLASAKSVNQHLKVLEGPIKEGKEEGKEEGKKESEKSRVKCLDTWLQVLPSFHVGGLSIQARAFISKTPVIHLSRWDVHAFVEKVRRFSVTLSSLVPAQVYDLVKEKYSCPSSIRAVLVGGGVLSPLLYWKARELGWPVLPTYGMTETCSQVATASLVSLENFCEKNFCEKDFKFPELEILSHLEVKANDEGRLLVRGSSLLTGVIEWRDQKVSFVDSKKQGWFLSNDYGEAVGKKLKFLGRKGDFIKIGGESVEMQRLRMVLEHVQIKQGVYDGCALLPVQNERLGHVIHLFVENSISKKKVEKILEGYQRQVLGFEKIRKWHFLNKIPRNSLGKVVISECLKQEVKSYDLEIKSEFR